MIDREEDEMDWERVTDQITKRVDTLEAAFWAFVGRDPEKVADDPKVFGVGVGAWVALATAFATALGAIGYVILGVKP